MTREIKFRAWWKNTNQMVGVLIKNLHQYIADDNAVVMQFTGLKDKNGKEIYEGDIVKQMWNPFQKPDMKHEIGEVIWKPTQGVVLMPISRPIWLHDCEVIGNIYQHRELLK